MAIIQSGATTDLLTIDPTSKAARATLYGPDGTLMVPGVAGYMQGINCGLSAAAVPGANSSLFHMRNAAAAANRVFIRRMSLYMLTLAAATAAQVVDLELVRTSGADMTGGTAVTQANMGRKHTTQGNPGVAEFRFAAAMAALTPGSVTFGQQLTTIMHSSLAGARSEVVLEFPADDGPLVLRAGEGIALRVLTAIGAGMTWSLRGNIEWDEQP